MCYYQLTFLLTSVWCLFQLMLRASSLVRSVIRREVGSLVRMTSSSDTLRQLRQLGGQVERMRTETRTFLESKERQLGEIQQQIQVTSFCVRFRAARNLVRCLDGRCKVVVRC